jgi:hypothetical protein
VSLRKFKLKLIQQQARKLTQSSTDAASRLVTEKARVAATTDASTLRRHFDNLTKPPSLSGGMRKAGIALIVTPDPISGVPGVALLTSSFIMKRKEPASLESLAKETRRVLREMQSLSL